MSYRIINGDCREVMRGMADGSVDSIVTDPPAGISFMNKEWDHHKGGRDHWIAWMEGVAQEALRVAKPGAHALVWALPRTAHWTATAWENAGWEVRDRVSHLFGSGFPKSRDVSKAIDAEAGAEREVVGRYRPPNGTDWNLANDKARSEIGAVGHSNRAASLDITAPATEAAQQWQGWGTALKPAMEDWWLLRKPLAGTVAQNVLKHGTGALNIDASRVSTTERMQGSRNPSANTGNIYGVDKGGVYEQNALGRWPANLIHDGSEEVEAAFAEFGERKAGAAGIRRGVNQVYGKLNGYGKPWGTYGDTGTVSRFFMKCPSDDPEFYECESCGIARHITELTRGCPQCGQTMTPLERGEGSRFYYCAKAGRSERWKHVVCSCCAQVISPASPVYKLKHCPVCGDEFKVTAHPTQKPIALLRYLTRFITPPGGTVLDMFVGSGSTGCAALAEGFNFIGIEMDAAYADIAEQRIAAAAATVQTDLFTRDQIPVTESDDVIKIDGDKMGTVAPDGTIWVGDNKRAYAGIVIVPRDQVPIAERHGWEVVGTENDLVWVRRVGRAAPEREG